jgi:transposase-like protein
MPDGRIRWRCPDCGKRWVESLYPKLPGTAAQRYFQRNRQQIYEAHKRWRERNHERWIALVSRAVKRWRERERLKGGGSAPN